MKRIEVEYIRDSIRSEFPFPDTGDYDYEVDCLMKKLEFDHISKDEFEEQLRNIYQEEIEMLKELEQEEE